MKPSFPLKEKDKQLAILIVAIIIVILDLIFVLGWQIKVLSMYNKNCKTTKENLVKLTADIKNINVFKQQNTQLDDKVNILNVAITNYENFPNLIESISNLASNTGVKIMQIKPVLDNASLRTIKEKNVEFDEIEIRIIAQAGFHQLANFISQLEAEKNFFNLYSLEIETDPKNYLIQNVKLSLRSVLNKL